jgi:hypothetical protein
MKTSNYDQWKLDTPYENFEYGDNGCKTCKEPCVGEEVYCPTCLDEMDREDAAEDAFDLAREDGIR